MFCNILEGFIKVLFSVVHIMAYTNLTEFRKKEYYDERNLFSIQKYEGMGDDRTTIGLGFNKDNKITFRVPKKIESNWEKILIDDKEIPVYFSKIFSTADIKGGITLEEVIKDAIPVDESLNEFFKPNKNSKYYGKVKGLHGGMMIICMFNECEIEFMIKDYNKKVDLTASYFLKRFKNEVADDWGNTTSLWSLKINPSFNVHNVRF